MIKYFLKNITFVVVGLFLFSGLFSSLVHAQESVGIKVQPAVIEDMAEPGETYSFTIRVTNVDNIEKTFFLVKQNIKSVNEDGLPVFADEQEETDYELSSWIDLPYESVDVPGGESREVPFSIKVPDNASPGSHFGGIFFDLKPPKLRTTGAGIGFRVGSIISLRISGEVVEDVRLREFTAGKLIFDSPNVDFKIRVENLGNSLIRPHGLLEITDMRGKQVSSLVVNEKGSSVFPKLERELNTKWEYDDFAFGRYQAVLGLVYGDDGKKTITGSISFWVLPLKPILIFLGSIFTIILLIYISVKVYIKRKLDSMGVVRGSRGSKNIYNSRRPGPVSKLTIVVAALLVFVVLFLIALFFLFA